MIDTPAAAGNSVAVDGTGMGAGKRKGKIMFAVNFPLCALCSAWDESYYKSENRKGAVPTHTIPRLDK